MRHGVGPVTPGFDEPLESPAIEEPGTSKFRDAGFRVWGLGFKVQGSWFRV